MSVEFVSWLVGFFSTFDRPHFLSTSWLAAHAGQAIDIYYVLCSDRSLVNIWGIINAQSLIDWSIRQRVWSMTNIWLGEAELCTTYRQVGQSIDYSWTVGRKRNRVDGCLLISQFLLLFSVDFQERPRQTSWHRSGLTDCLWQTDCRGRLTIYK